MVRLTSIHRHPGALPAVFAAAACLLLTPSPARTEPPAPPAPAWAPFVEPGFPFFSSVLDARNTGPGWPTNNLTPRGLILKLDHGCWACFDTDLLRVAAVWYGPGVSPAAMSQISYHIPGAKTPEGQEHLPQIVGDLWLANGLYPGWQTGSTVNLTDPRPPTPDPMEVGRGPIDPRRGRFRAVRFTGDGVRLEYEVAGTAVTEWISAGDFAGRARVERRVRLAAVPQPLIWVIGQRPVSAQPPLATALLFNSGDRPLPVSMSGDPAGLTVARIGVSSQPVEFTWSLGPRPPALPALAAATNPPVRWPESVVTTGSLATNGGAYVVDNIALPLANPWRRNVRLADLAFLRDGRAAAVTFDGDVWLVEGLRDDLEHVTWRRFTSGFHEPLGICVRNEELFVVDRNGLWRLPKPDATGGAADRQELFANNYAQTAETREFASGVRAAPDGSFLLAKGGQQASTTGRHNGTILRVAPDGASASVLGWGLRQPFLGVNPVTGLVTASDQEGHYIPTTPLHVIRDGQYYGFLSARMPKEVYPAPIADALTWIPHTINASAAGQVWLHGARMGPLNEELLLLSYYRPEVFLVLLNDPAHPTQAAVVSVTGDLRFAPLNGAVNPADGQLYVAGFQSWGTEAPQISGLARVRHTGRPSPLPRSVLPYAEGVWLRFDQALDPAAARNPANYSVERWQYSRTANYGSPHLRRDGRPGQEVLLPADVQLSADGRAVFLVLPDMQPVMQLRVGWSLANRAGETLAQEAYLTVHEMPAFQPAAAGFAPFFADLAPRTPGPTAAATPVTVAEGRRLATLLGCAACHSVDGSLAGKVGPTWKGLFGSRVPLKGGGEVLADAAYLRESILEPQAKIVRGFDHADAGMPSYAGVITDPQLTALVRYLESLR